MSVLDPGLNPSLQLVLVRELVEHVFDAEEERVRLFPLLSSQRDGAGPREWKAALRTVERSGLLMVTHPPAGEDAGWIYTCGTMIEGGEEVVREMRGRRGSSIARRRAARDAALYGLHDQIDRSGQAELSVPALGVWGAFYGDPFSDHEVYEAGTWLLDQRFISGSPTWGGPVVRPDLTPRGERVVANKRSVNEETEGSSNGATHTTIHQTGTGHVALAAGAYSELAATVHQGFSQDQRQQVLDVAASLAALAPLLGLDEPTRAQAERVHQDLRAAVQDPEPDPGLIQRSLEQVRDLAVLGTASAFGNSLAAHATSVLAALGMG